MYLLDTSTIFATCIYLAITFDEAVQDISTNLTKCVIKQNPNS